MQRGQHATSGCDESQRQGLQRTTAATARHIRQCLADMGTTGRHAANPEHERRAWRHTDLCRKIAASRDTCSSQVQWRARMSAAYQRHVGRLGSTNTGSRRALLGEDGVQYGDCVNGGHVGHAQEWLAIDVLAFNVILVQPRANVRAFGRAITDGTLTALRWPTNDASDTLFRRSLMVSQASASRTVRTNMHQHRRSSGLAHGAVRPELAV